MSKVRPALRLSFAAEYTTQAMGFVSVMILARLLTPEEIGIFSLALSVVLVAQEFRSFGVGQFIIQEAELTENKIRTATGILFLASWFLAALLAGASSLVADFYEEPGLRAVLLVLACNFVVMPFNGATDAYLQRQMQFDKLYRVKVGSTFVYTMAVLGLAFVGFGYMSMAWAALLGTITSVLALNWYRPAYVPFVPGFRELRRIWSFGAFATGAGILGQIGRVSPEVIIGRALSMADVGYFSRAFGLVRIFEQAVLAAIRPVMLPHFSAKRREGEEGAAAAYLQCVSLVTCVAWPFFGFVALMAYPVVRILYGDQWDAAVPVAQALCLGGILQALFAFSTQALTAGGGIRQVLLMNAIVVAFRIAVIVLCVRYGLVWVALAVTASSLIQFVVSSFLIRRVIGLDMWSPLRASAPSLAVTVYALLAPVGVTFTMEIGPGSYWIPFIIAAVGTGGGWFLGIFVVRHEVREEVMKLWGKVRASLVPGNV